MEIFRTSTVVLIIAAVLAASLGFYVGRITAPSPPKLPEVVVAYSLAGQTFSGPMLAKELGLFEKHGVYGSVVYISGGAMAASIIGGSVHIGVGPPVSTVASNQLAGEDLIIIMVSGYSGPISLWARPGITKPQDLIGKKIAVATLQGPHHLYVLHALKVWGIDQAQVTIVGMSTAPMIEAMKAGTLDAGMVSNDYYYVAKEAGLNKIIDLWDIPGADKFFFGPVVARKSWVEAHPRETVNTLKAIIEGYQYYANNKDSLKLIESYVGQSAEEMGKVYEISINVFKRGLNYVPTRDELVFNLEMYSLFDKKLLNADVDKLWDLTYFKQALTELGMLK